MSLLRHTTFYTMIHITIHIIMALLHVIYHALFTDVSTETVLHFSKLYCISDIRPSHGFRNTLDLSVDGNDLFIYLSSCSRQ